MNAISELMKRGYYSAKSNVVDYLSIFLSLIAGFVSFLFLAVQAQAALHAAVATTFTAITTDFQALMDLAWPLIAVVVSAFWIIRSFKKVVFST